MHKRINITLPEETIGLLERICGKGARSRLIDVAIRRHAEELGKAALRNRLKQGYEQRAAHDLKTAEAWFFIGEEAWGADER